MLLLSEVKCFFSKIFKETKTSDSSSLDTDWVWLVILLSFSVLHFYFDTHLSHKNLGAFLGVLEYITPRRLPLQLEWLAQPLFKEMPWVVIISHTLQLLQVSCFP